MSYLAASSRSTFISCFAFTWVPLRVKGNLPTSQTRSDKVVHHAASQIAHQQRSLPENVAAMGVMVVNPFRQ